jgi:hypothetical protein
MQLGEHLGFLVRFPFGHKRCAGSTWTRCGADTACTMFMPLPWPVNWVPLYSLVGLQLEPVGGADETSLSVFTSLQ